MGQPWPVALTVWQQNFIHSFIH